MSECKQSKSLKADKDLMWKKLSTPPKPPGAGFFWNQSAGIAQGEMALFAVGRSTGKSMIATQALGRALRKLGNV